MAVGPQELLIILLVALLLFGTNRLSEVGKGLGEGIRNFKKGLDGAPIESKKPTPQPKAESKRLPPRVHQGPQDDGEVDRSKEENA